jgi:hypothetical protein
MPKEKDEFSSLVSRFNGRNPNAKDISDVCAEAMKDNNFGYANWLLSRFLGRIDKIKYAVFAAELVIDKYEERYPNDTAPREAIEAAKKVVESDNEENRKAALKASYAVTDYAAAYYDSVSYAAAYAAIAAYVAADSATSAFACSAADSAAADTEVKSKIIEFGLSLIGDNEK